MSAMQALAEQTGFSLLEVLVTLIVLSLGILGLAGLQSAALKNGHSALLRAQAAQYAYDMADRMRANRQQAVSTALPYNMGLSSTPPTGAGLPTSDRAGWIRQLQSLPEGAGAIAVTPAGNVTITVRWDETALGNTATDPTCPEPRLAGRVCFVLDTRI